MYIYGGDNEIKPVEHEKGLNFNLYSIDDLIQVKSKIQELKKQIKLPPKQDKHRQKKIYAQIVRVLSENIEYDHWGAGVSKEKYERNIYGCFFRGKRNFKYNAIKFSK